MSEKTHSEIKELNDQITHRVWELFMGMETPGYYPVLAGPEQLEWSTPQEIQKGNLSQLTPMETKSIIRQMVEQELKNHGEVLIYHSPEAGVTSFEDQPEIKEDPQWKSWFPQEGELPLFIGWD